MHRLVLIEAGFGPFTHPDQNVYWETVLQLMPSDGFATFEDYVDLVMKLFPRSDRAIVEASRPYFVQDDAGRWRWSFLADFAVINIDSPTSEEERALRARVTCPVLVVRSEHSELFVGDAFREVANEYANGSASLLRDSGHNVMWENVPGLVALITA